MANGTYNLYELRKLVVKEDPVVDPDDDKSYVDQEGRLIVPGTNTETSWSADLMIEPTPEGWQLWYRDPEGLGSGGQATYGRDWVKDRVWSDFEEMRVFIYEM